MIVLFFGQPAAGKTTLAKEFINANTSMRFMHVDGDEWREITKNKDYSKEGRLRNLKGAFDMALYLEKKGFAVILSFVTPFSELRAYLSENAIQYAQIYLTYSGDRGRNMNFANEFEQPLDEHLHIDTSETSIYQSTSKIIKYVAQKISRS